ncbi:MAG: AAA family ATPase [Paramuribaculum sp.]|nr:AAA family ATPase [Paramuribaculum sp.]MDE6303685.1 AAA family ATPase [Paramuribaculum sp.]
MITRLKIHNFKIHTDSDLQLAPLTILTGMNGMGKSSVMQSLLILRESVLKGDYPSRLNLKGDSFSVGKSFTLINWDIVDNPDRMTLSLTIDGREMDFTFGYPEQSESRLPAIEGVPLPEREDIEKFSLFVPGGVQYLSAFRYGPRGMYESNSSIVDDSGEVSYHLGQGEYAVYYLAKYGHKPVVVEQMLYEDTDDENEKTLKNQVDKWLSEISPDISVQLTQFDKDKYSLKYLHTREGRGNIEVEALNTGYGVTYILSVVTALLSARPGSLVMIENPEAHIHPAAQSALMRLISKACAGGVQVILETHSDHIVNGALVNLKLKVLKPGDLMIYFFDRETTSRPVRILPLKIGRDCRLKKTPPRFFSQMNRDLDILFGL